MTWALPADQRRLLDIFDNQPGTLNDARELTASHPLIQSDADHLLLWADNPCRDRGHHRPRNVGGGLPDAIVVRAGGMRKFLAWATTVFGGYRPFTAFFKVVARHHLEQDLPSQEPALGAVENALVGLILGDALAHSTGSQRSVTGLSLLPCESTYAFTFARAWALGFQGGASVDSVREPWALVRKLTRQSPRRLNDDSIRTALEVVTFLAGGSDAHSQSRVPAFILEACGEIHAGGEVTTSWPLLEGDLGGLGHEMKGTREQRVRAFERVLRDTTNLEPVSAAFLTGLLADQIGPGTLEHVELLSPYLHEHPMAAVWYGLCAGLHPQSEVQQVGNCLGRRIARDLLVSDSIVSRPKYDISVSELEVCLDRDVPVEFRTASQNHMAVELLPGVPAFVKWPVKDAHPTAEGAPASGAASTAQGHQRELFDGSDIDLVAEGQAALADIERAAARAKVVFAELSRRGAKDGRTRGGGRRRRRR